RRGPELKPIHRRSRGGLRGLPCSFTPPRTIPHPEKFVMRILILGSNGQLGSDLLRAAQRHPGLTLIPLQRADLDVTDTASIGPALAGREFDALVNCTSYHKTDEVEANADKAMKINAFAVRALAEACAANSARFL